MRFLAGRLRMGSFRRREPWAVRLGRAHLWKETFPGGYLRVRRNRKRHPGRAVRAMLWEMKGTSLETLWRGKAVRVRRPEMQGMNLEKLQRARERVEVLKKEMPRTVRLQPERTVRAMTLEVRGTSLEVLLKEKAVRVRRLEMQGMGRENLRREKEQRRSPGKGIQPAPL